MNNDSLPVEEVNAEVVPFTAIDDKGRFIKDDTPDNVEIVNKSIEIIKSTEIVEDNEILTFNYRMQNPTYFDDIRGYGKNRNHTTKQQPNKKSKKSARRNNRRAKRNNR